MDRYDCTAKSAARLQGGLVAFVVALLAAGAGAAEAPKAPARPEREWGDSKAGLQLSAAMEGEARVGGKLVFRLALRNVGQGAVGVGEAGKMFVWGFLIQGTTARLFTEKVFPARDMEGWSPSLAGGGTVELEPFDISALNAYTYRKGLKLAGGYPTAGDGAKLSPDGKAANLLIVGEAKVRWMMYLAGERPMMLSSNTLAFAIGPPAMESLSPEAREAFARKLIAQYKRDAWGGQQAHAVAVKLGKPVVPYLIEAVNVRAPGHAKMWMGTSLCHIRDARAATALIDLLKREQLTQIIAYHGPAQRSEKLDDAIIAAVVKKRDPRTTALAVLGFMGKRKSVPEKLLKIGLDSDDPRTRATVAEAFSRHASNENVVRLVALLTDTDEKVRATAGRLLGKLGDRRRTVMEALVRALDLPGEYARQRICTALSELSGRSGPYDPKAPAQARLKVIAGWKTWWAQATRNH